MASKIKVREQKKARELTTLWMFLNCKGGRMRHRANRRAKDARRAKEDFT
jgi:hypothetical protein